MLNTTRPQCKRPLGRTVVDRELRIGATVSDSGRFQSFEPPSLATKPETFLTSYPTHRSVSEFPATLLCGPWDYGRGATRVGPGKEGAEALERGKVRILGHSFPVSDPLPFSLAALSFPSTPAPISAAIPCIHTSHVASVANAPGQLPIFVAPLPLPLAILPIRLLCAPYLTWYRAMWQASV